MDANPWEAPEQRGARPAPSRPARRGRGRWKRLCLESLAVLAACVLTFLACCGVCLLFDLEPPLWFALGFLGVALSCGVMGGVVGAVIGGIGWMLTALWAGSRAGAGRGSTRPPG